MFRLLRSSLRVGIFVSAASALVLGACSSSTPATSTPTRAAVPTVAPTTAPVAVQQLKITLGAVGSSGQAGTATLTAKGEQTEVVLVIGPGAPGVTQPAHIHDTECQLPPKVIHPLSNVLDGKSTTLVNASLSTLRSKPLSVCVHKSAQEVTTYVASGVLTLQAVVKNLAIPDITIPTGTTIVWVNNDTTAHTSTSGTNGKFDSKGWNSPLDPGQTFNQTFNEAGTFAYTCVIHPTMNAKVTVAVGGTASVAKPPASSTGDSDYNY